MGTPGTPFIFVALFLTALIFSCCSYLPWSLLHEAFYSFYLLAFSSVSHEKMGFNMHSWQTFYQSVIFFFVEPHLWHMEVPMEGVELELELQLPATAQQHQI